VTPYMMCKLREFEIILCFSSASLYRRAGNGKKNFLTMDKEKKKIQSSIQNKLLKSNPSWPELIQQGRLFPPR
jgi:hypothetical protein